LDWIRNQVKLLDIDVKLSYCPELEELEKYDIVLNATGASSYSPDIYGANKITGFESVIACPKVSCEYHPGERKNEKVGEKVVIWGDHYAAADTATFLASIGKDVTVVTENKEFGSSIEVIHMYVLRKRFNQTDAEGLHSKPFKYPVKLVENSTIYQVGDGEVIVQNKEFERKSILADTVISCKLHPNISLYHELIEANVRVYNVGDAVKPRNLHAAVREGAEFGLNLDNDMLFNSNNAVMNSIPIDVLEQLKR